MNLNFRDGGIPITTFLSFGGVVPSGGIPTRHSDYLLTITSLQMVHHSGVLMMTYLTTKLLAVSDEAGADVVHYFDLNVHCKMELPEHLFFSPDSGCAITVVKLVLLGA